MADVTLLHNDDEVLDPTDSTLRTRGSVEVDGKEKGSWEEHLNGTWTALIDGESFSAASKDALIERLGMYLS
ncbi:MULTISPECIES: hypothetical protein [Burkholderiaceae]|jgi:hypothetical protein|uniref:Uncharacterized protein n=1 Tax=Burkholderia vietnamiensis TaxID=60552 RepID=A0AAW7TD45_BURVI|nr:MULTISPECIES: hypothetical protein [Burkholderiaceae]MDN7799440.1 hypothetical protein [Burkholderia vietnamiensis]RFU44254.1 hypothetical protein D0B32_28890 [Paraburkholderia sp. DHOC27]